MKMLPTMNQNGTPPLKNPGSATGGSVIWCLNQINIHVKKCLTLLIVNVGLVNVIESTPNKQGTSAKQDRLEMKKI